MRIVSPHRLDAAPETKSEEQQFDTSLWSPRPWPLCATCWRISPTSNSISGTRVPGYAYSFEYAS
eukprot:3066796-Rhodomonas_salina.3